MVDRIRGWDSIEVGAALPELTLRPDTKQIFMFSAITWNRHAIHYDREWARSEGLPDVVVQRALLGNFLARLILQWAEEKGDLARLEWKVVHSALPGDTLTCRGVIRGKATEKDRRLVTCDVEIVNQHSATIALGNAVIKIG